MHVWDDLETSRPPGRGLFLLWRLKPFIAPYRWVLVGGAVALLASAGAVLAFGSVLRTLIDSGFDNADPEALKQVLVTLFVVVLIMSVAAGFRIFLVAWLGERVVADLRKAVFRKVLTLDPGFFEHTPTGEVVSRLTADTVLIQTIVGFTLAVALRNVILIVGGLVLMIVTSPLLTTILIGGLPVVALIAWLLGHRIRRLSRETQDAIAAVGGRIDETLHAIQTVQASVQEKQEQNRFAMRVEAAFSAAIARAATGATLAAAVMLLIFGLIGSILWLGGQGVIEGRISAGEMAAFLFYAVVVAGSLTTMSEVFSELMRGAGATERLLQLLTARTDIEAPEEPAAWPKDGSGHLRIEKLGFTYPTRPGSPSLRDIDFDLAPGSNIAIVGPSGAGKSTLFQLLLRFHDPDEGRILIDDVDIRCLDPRVLRRHVALVPQDPVLFSGTVRENIAYANPAASETAILEAARIAHVLEFAETLPEGMETALGERGVRLSGGQRARVALARAILTNPEILLLDEATSALDAESERLVQNAIERIRMGRTVLTIAHRLATVRSADRILVLQQGRIVADGSHHQLLQENGLYAHLCRLQLQTELPG
jgi:ATP-binding cassette subfamily B protein